MMTVKVSGSLFLGPQTWRERCSPSLKSVLGILCKRVGTFEDVHCSTVCKSERLEKCIYPSVGDVLKKEKTNIENVHVDHLLGILCLLIKITQFSLRSSAFPHAV